MMPVGLILCLPLEGKVDNSLANWSDEVETLPLDLYINKRINM